MEAGDEEHKEKRRNGRALRGSNSDWAESLRCVLEDESARVFGKERLNSGNQIGGDPPFGQDTSQLVSTDVVKITFHVRK